MFLKLDAYQYQYLIAASAQSFDVLCNVKESH